MKKFVYGFVAFCLVFGGVDTLSRGIIRESIVRMALGALTIAVGTAYAFLFCRDEKK